MNQCQMFFFVIVGLSTFCLFIRSVGKTETIRDFHEWLEAHEVAVAGWNKLLREVGRGYKKSSDPRTTPRIVSAKPKGNLN